MKKLLIQPYLLLVIALGVISTGCEDNKPMLPEINVTLQSLPNANDLTVVFTPTEGTASYMFCIGTEADKASFLDKIHPGTTFVTGAKETTFTFDELDSKTNYTIFAVAFNQDGVAGPVAMPTYQTYTSTFLVNAYYVTDNTAAFKIETSTDYSSYQYYLGTADDKDEFDNNNIEGIKTQREAYKFIENYFSLEPDTEYVFFAKGIDRAGKNTKTFEIPIKTASLDSNEIPNVTFEVTDNNFYKQYYTVTPNEKCKMIALYQQTKGLQDDMFYDPSAAAGDLLSILDAWQSLGSNALKYSKCYTAVNQTLIADPINFDLKLDLDLDIYVVIYDANFKPTSVKKFKNKVPAKNTSLSVENLGGTIEVSDPTYTSVKIKIELNSNTMAGLFDIVDGKWLDEEMKKPEFNEFSTIQELFLANILTSGGWLYKKDNNLVEDTIVDPDMMPGKKYYIVLCPLNANGPIDGGWGRIVKKEFNTPAAPSAL